MTDQLSTLNLGAAPGRPMTPPSGPGILHFGLGNFHRAHQAVYTAAALDAQPGPWGIVGIANRSRRVVDPLRNQDGFYSVLTLAPQRTTVEVLGLHQDLLVASEQPEQVSAYVADSRIRVVTLTVTENGYTYAAATGGLDLDDEAVQADLAGQPPKTVIGQLARGLQARFRADGEPLAIVSCDNLSDNGQRTQNLVTEFLERTAEADGAEMLVWMRASVSFPSTMVDRIVPATEPHHLTLAAELLGVADRAPVPAEPFSMWVLQDSFPGGRPAWEAGGAIFTDDVTAYELMKLRLLNASNSMLAYLGLLTGRRYIWEAVRTEDIRRVVEHLMREEMLPTMRVPDGVDVERYLADLFERFGNEAVGHRTSQVGSDGSSKLPVRITGPVLHHLADSGHPPGAIALLVAAFIRCLSSPDSYPAEVTGRPEDPRARPLAELGQRHASSRDLVRAVFDDAGVFESSLAEATPFVDRVVELHKILETGDVEAAIRQALA